MRLLCCFASKADRTDGEMGTCIRRSADQRKRHIEKFNAVMEKHYKGHFKYKSGEPVEVLWKGDYWPAVINSLRLENGKECYEVKWATYTNERLYDIISPEAIREVPHYEEGDLVKALWMGEYYDAEIMKSNFGTSYDVEWGAAKTFGVQPNQVKPRSRPIPQKERYDHQTHGLIRIRITEALGIPKSDLFGHKAGDPFVEVYDRKGRLITATKVEQNTTNPRWNHEETVRIANTNLLYFAVKDEDLSVLSGCAFRNELVCEGILAPAFGLNMVSNGGRFRGVVPLFKDPHIGRPKPSGELMVEIECLEAENEKAGKTLTWEIPRTKFAATSGNRVSLYQSAHVGREWNQRLAPISLYEYTNLARPYERESYWVDLYHRMRLSRELIYVYGWSVDPSMQLIREMPPPASERLSPNSKEFHGMEASGPSSIKPDTPESLKQALWKKWHHRLGDVLKEKANQGVKVLIMIWNDATGMAGTGSASCASYFRGTNVKVRLMMRSVASVRLTATLTHHQKGVILDAPVDNESSRKRRLIAFLGGIDLTGGRWDCPGKHLFNIHEHDYYQNLVNSGGKNVMRQPWEDIHCMVEGQLAHDALTNFHQRWSTQGHREELYRGNAIIPMQDDVLLDEQNAEAWNAQLFRSVDTTSDFTVNGIESDCHRAWVYAIEKSRRFLFIENQYFMGSSELWSEKPDAGASNMIPATIVKRIQRAIRQNDPYCAYILIPLFPEGDPSSAPMQELLHWQYHTIKAMYKEIGSTLNDVKSQSHPQDYLQFFATCNKESLSDACEKAIAKEMPKDGVFKKFTELKKLIKNRRCPIYVHSKMLIVDDEYIIMGSANINDRSMSGNRDTEIAVGLCQPHFIRQSATGMVRCFRMSLWTEHLNFMGSYPSQIERPELPECARYVRDRTDKAWKEYCDSSSKGITCHLVTYPYTIDRNGILTSNGKEFPDFSGAKITGSNSYFVCDFLTA